MLARSRVFTGPCKGSAALGNNSTICLRRNLRLVVHVQSQSHAEEGQALDKQHKCPSIARQTQEPAICCNDKHKLRSWKAMKRLQFLLKQVKQMKQLLFSTRRQQQTTALHTVSPDALTCGQAAQLTFAMLPSLGHPLQALLAGFKWLLAFLSQPPGGSPVEVVNWVPGWRQHLTRGPRRWLGLRPGRLQPSIDPGPWFTLSGMLHLLRRLPCGVWVALILYASIKLVQHGQKRRQERDKFIQQRTLIAAAKTSDLRVQKDRMLRALGTEQEEDGDVIVVEAADVQWQDPSDWDPATKQQWDDFMRKSRALQLNKDKWWDVETVDDVPYFKVAHDKLKDSGELPDYSLE